MSQLADWRPRLAAMLGCNELGYEQLAGKEGLGPQTSRFSQSSEIAHDYLTHLAPVVDSRIGPFIFFNGPAIEDSLTGLVYSNELIEFGFLPIGEFENDKLLCIDCEFPGFVVLQLGMGTIQPIRKFLLLRFSEFAHFFNFILWKSEQ